MRISGPISAVIENLSSRFVMTRFRQLRAALRLLIFVLEQAVIRSEVRKGSRSMKPRLMAISGPLEGQLIDLTKPETILGRDPVSEIHLEDELVSRRHCEIARSGESFVIRDLDSRNETFVNGLPVQQQALQHGDRVQAGESLFFFVNEGEEIPSARAELEAVQDSDSERTRSVTQLSLEDSRYLKFSRTAPEESDESPSARTVRGFEILLDISRDVGVVRNLEDLQERLLLSMFEAFPTERARYFFGPHWRCGHCRVFLSVCATPQSPGAIEVHREPYGPGKGLVDQASIVE